MGMSKVNSENSRMSVHGSVLCWTARIASTVLSLIAVLYILSRAIWDSGWVVVPAAILVFVVSITPSMVAWWSHRIGGAFVLIICLLYTGTADVLAGEAAFVHIVLPFSVVWIASGILHLVVSWKERKLAQPGI